MPDTDNDEVQDSSEVRDSPKNNERFDENQEVSCAQNRSALSGC